MATPLQGSHSQLLLSTTYDTCPRATGPAIELTSPVGLLSQQDDVLCEAEERLPLHSLLDWCSPRILSTVLAYFVGETDTLKKRLLGLGRW